MGYKGFLLVRSNWKRTDPVRAQIWDVNVRSWASIRFCYRFCTSLSCLHFEGCWSLTGRLFILDFAESTLSSDAVVVVHGVEQLGTNKVVALDCSRTTCEVLDTVSGGLPCSIASNLPQQDIPCLGRCVSVGDGYCDYVC